MTDLWPDDFGQANVTPPVTILREQSRILAKKTKGLVEGFVVTDGGKAGGFTHAFYLKAPALEDYTFLLFRVSHPVEMYPVEFQTDFLEEGRLRAATEEEFANRLRTIFAAEKTKQIVRAIQAQSDAVTA